MRLFISLLFVQVISNEGLFWILLKVGKSEIQAVSCLVSDVVLRWPSSCPGGRQEGTFRGISVVFVTRGIELRVLHMQGQVPYV